MSNQLAHSLLATLHACHFEVEDHAIWLGMAYDFGGESQQRTYLETSRVDDELRAEIRSTLEVDHGSGVDQAFSIRLLLYFDPANARVESFIEAHLGVAIGDYQPGTHVLYQHRTENLDPEGALRAAREHVQALVEIDDYPETLGLSRR
ncbi:hypothetical protein Ais01nite_27500 [Asanoa ishikariensis]|uniref:Uncharacterized protein n=1 Tax=Asanoa ishikariensis TaxID=137265 RepID=A0A1H3QTK4_9ACTN|nr:hypothetical protein [Asanoa ishikariensis]GIF64715.1 hypothetical protein Ais01nite_27500 [Asanoa ishikariensis]SDZ16660.1 hypothetical protein SAMN05421684_3171 [Asanoa ishikariensis]